MKRPPDGDPQLVRIFLRSELLTSGMDDRAIARAVAAEDLVRVRHGAYVVAADWTGRDHVARHRIVVRAALRQARVEATVSHASALPEYDAPTWGVDLSVVHLNRGDPIAGRTVSGVRRHRGVLRPQDVVRRNGLNVTSPAVTVIENIATTATETGLCIANHFLHQQLVSPEKLDEVRQFHDHRPHTLSADLVLRLADARVESVGESRTFYAFWRQGLPPPQPQFVVRDSGGNEVARVDFAWPDRGVFVEFDGKVKYGRLIPEGKTLADVLDAEKAREEMICRLTGWRCIRITWADLAYPVRLAWRVRSMFDLKDASA